MVNVSLDVRYGLRKLNNSAGFTAIAVFCLALGICASVTVFSVVNGLLLRPIPGVTGQDRLVTLISKPFHIEGVADSFTQPLSYPVFLQYQEGNHAFTDLVTYLPLVGNLVAGGEPLRVTGEVVTDNYFTTLGLHPTLGRLFAPGEGRREEQPGIVISHALWQRVFGGRQQAIGSGVNLNGAAFLVIGVTPEGFRGTVHGNEADFWVPIETASLVVPGKRGRDLNDPARAWLFWFFGRLRPGMDVESAQQEMDRTARLLGAGLPEAQRPPELQVHQAFGIRAGTLGAVASPLALLSAVVALLMLVVCANLGGLLLVKAASRQEEIGVRLALGVTRGRLVRQLLTESVALALIGGTVGFLMALWTVDALQGISLGKSFPRISHLAIDGRVVAFTLALSLGAGIFFGLIPALWSTRRQVVPLLRRGGAAGQDRSRTRLQEMLVVGQVMVSLLLLVITGLFVRTLRNLESIDPGFDSSGILNVRIDLSLRGLPDARGLDLYGQLLPQVRRLPGVRSAALASRVLLSVPDGTAGLVGLQPERGPAAGGKPLWSEFNVISPGYFQTLGIPLVRGRDFSDLDRAGSPAVLIVDETLADALWPGRDPIGESIVMAATGEVREVVGVARNVRVIDLQGDLKPYFYMPLAQLYQPALALQVKTVGDPLQAADRIRTILRKLDPSLAVQVSRFDDELREVVALQRLFSWVFGAYSLLAVVITATGLYGTLSYAVSRRTRELGIRMALGARASEIVVLVLRRGLGLTLAGLVLGLFAAAWTTSIFSGYLFGVAPTDTGVFVSVAVLLALVGLAASSLPAYSATRVDPMAIIRHE